MEQNLANKVEQMLQAVLGPGRATVRVSAEVNMTSVQMITETYSPTGKVATKEEIKSNSETEPATGGEAGKTAGRRSQERRDSNDRIRCRQNSGTKDQRSGNGNIAVSRRRS